MPYDENVSSLLWFLPSCRVDEKNWLAWKETLLLKKIAHNVKNRVIFLEPDRSNLMTIRQKKCGIRRGKNQLLMMAQEMKPIVQNSIG